MNKERTIWVDGEKVSVSEEVYRAYKRPIWKERKRKEIRAKKERSLDAFIDDGFDIPSEQPLTNLILADRILLDELFAALGELTDDERSLINALYCNEKSERDVATDKHISRQAVHKKKNRILAKLRNLIKK